MPREYATFSSDALQMRITNALAIMSVSRAKFCRKYSRVERATLMPTICRGGITSIYCGSASLHDALHGTTEGRPVVVRRAVLG